MSGRSLIRGKTGLHAREWVPYGSIPGFPRHFHQLEVAYKNDETTDLDSRAFALTSRFGNTCMRNLRLRPR